MPQNCGALGSAVMALMILFSYFGLLPCLMAPRTFKSNEKNQPTPRKWEGGTFNVCVVLKHINVPKTLKHINPVQDQVIFGMTDNNEDSISDTDWDDISKIFQKYTF